MSSENFARRLGVVREHFGDDRERTSIPTFARQLGIAEKSLYNWERKGHRPQKGVRDLARAFERLRDRVDPHALADWVFTGNGEMPGSSAGGSTVPDVSAPVPPAQPVVRAGDSALGPGEELLTSGDRATLDRLEQEAAQAMELAERRRGELADHVVSLLESALADAKAMREQDATDLAKQEYRASSYQTLLRVKAILARAKRAGIALTVLLSLGQADAAQVDFFLRREPSKKISNGRRARRYRPSRLTSRRARGAPRLKVLTGGDHFAASAVA